MRRLAEFVAIGVLTVGTVGCLPGTDQGMQAPKPARAARLVLGSVAADQGGIALNCASTRTRWPTVRAWSRSSCRRAAAG